MKPAYTLGLDYGTNSVRALIVRCADGDELASAVVPYPSGEAGILLAAQSPQLARQHPGDYLYGLQKSVRRALARAKKAEPAFSPAQVVGVGIAATGSSPLPVDAANRPLALLPQFAQNLAAQCWLWKDHTSWREAEQITQLAAQHRPQFIAKCGNTYSSEWFWSKIWHCLNTAPEVFAAAHSWVELADWLPSVLAGVDAPERIVRSVCCAGHKALYAEDWGGLPDAAFLQTLAPPLAALRERLYEKAHDALTPAGQLCPEWARTLGLRSGIPISVGAVDVHYGAIGCGIKEGALVKVLGTSSCDCAVISAEKAVPDIPGICGIVNGSILPGTYGIEAGQPAVGDIFKWFVEGVLGDRSGRSHARLSAAAAALRPGQSGLLALDWNNGSRSPLIDPMLSGLLLGQTLHTTPGEIYRALIEASAFGARAIIERLKDYGVPVKTVICAGGIAEKNPLLMQLYADITGCTMRISRSSQACALGAAVTAAVIAGAHKNFAAAQRAMTGLQQIIYRPRSKAQKAYEPLYALYCQLQAAFGGLNPQSDLGQIMKQLLAIKEAATADSR